ncbi:hypothetical protein OG787_21255 [Streptomyces sp. NBC_00075]|uniref:Uncharacterized protein n=1 Tax=Streptomyces sp. NBC_00093 TaxID=2975649 RepID=A0AAU1ZZU3_9ACTN
MDKFLARSARYQSLMRAEIARLVLDTARVVEAVADAVSGAVR